MMGNLFGAFRKKETAGDSFIFRIDDMFAMKTGDCVVTGEVLQGCIRVNDGVGYFNTQGEPVLRAVIGGIEYGPEGPRKSAQPNPTGIYGSHYGLLIKGYTKERFEAGGFLRK